MKRTAAVLLAWCAASIACAEPASTIRKTDLQEQSQSDAATIATLPANTKVEVLRRVGAWSEVKTEAGQHGWVRMTTLKFSAGGNLPSTAKGTSGNSVSGLTHLLSSGRTSNSGTVTTGVRGLTAEDLENAQADTDEFEKLQQFAADKEAATAFAKKAKLTSSKIDYLPESSAGGNNSRSGRN